ncbi:uncharacterized protein KY384_000911 [Bacidia gigantensis]|uniref:uncharacterized protein n=1 Tax=Bacidia gigantensis TaxID=2732470 RepID=UPI001D059AC6|nr:uncharacterized protein KY384_000911 [Bacidia gigantensis]KAG8534068.1 hypothetical protein KY384_000911 [Bacidia gigantensis]
MSYNAIRVCDCTTSVETGHSTNVQSIETMGKGKPKSKRQSFLTDPVKGGIRKAKLKEKKKAQKVLKGGEQRHALDQVWWTTRKQAKQWVSHAQRVGKFGKLSSQAWGQFFRLLKSPTRFTFDEAMKNPEQELIIGWIFNVFWREREEASRANGVNDYESPDNWWDMNALPGSQAPSHRADVSAEQTDREKRSKVNKLPAIGFGPKISTAESGLDRYFAPRPAAKAPSSKAVELSQDEDEVGDTVSETEEESEDGEDCFMGGVALPLRPKG